MSSSSKSQQSDRSDDGSDESVKQIETSHCNPLQLVAYLCFTILVIASGLALSMILPDPYIYTTESTWNCPEGLKEFDREICTGIDMLHEPFDYLIGNSDGKPVKNNLVLFGQPVNKEPPIGIHYEIEFWINTTDLKKGKTYNDTKYLFFGCWPDQSCDRITLLEFSGYNYNYSIGIKETVNQGLRLEGWVSDFVLTWRHDNLKFEKLFVWFLDSR